MKYILCQLSASTCECCINLYVYVCHTISLNICISAWLVLVRIYQQLNDSWSYSWKGSQRLAPVTKARLHAYDFSIPLSKQSLTKLFNQFFVTRSGIDNICPETHTRLPKSFDLPIQGNHRWDLKFGIYIYAINIQIDIGRKKKCPFPG